MDIFDILQAVSKKKNEFIRQGMEEKEALIKAELFISGEYHISFCDVKRLYNAA